MQLPQPLRLQHYKRRRNRRRDRKIRRIDLIKQSSAPGHRLRWVPKGMIHVGTVAGQFAVAAGHVVRAGGAVGDVGVLLGDFVEDGFGNAKVFGEDGFGRFGDPVVEVEGRPVPSISIGFASKTMLQRQPVHTRLCQNPHHRRQEGTRSPHRGLGRCAPALSESTCLFISNRESAHRNALP